MDAIRAVGFRHKDRRHGVQILEDDERIVIIVNSTTF